MMNAEPARYIDLVVARALDEAALSVKGKTREKQHREQQGWCTRATLVLVHGPEIDDLMDAWLMCVVNGTIYVF